MKIENKKIGAIIYSIIPIVFLFYFLWLFSLRSPFYHSYNSDPQYIHVYSALNLAEGVIEIGNLDNPGTPLQVFEAVVMRLSHPFVGEKSLTEDFLANPELYLKIINHSLLAVTAIVLFFVGFKAWYFSRNIFLALLLQLSPFSTWTIFGSFLLASPETLLIIVSLLFLIVFFPVIYNNQLKFKNLIYIALITGLGIATKLTFVPLFFIPFIVFPTWKQKILFAILSFAFFLLFISPALSHLDYLITWVSDLVSKKGKYGSGETGIVDTAKFIANFKRKLIFEKTLTISLCLSFLIWIFIRFRLKEHKSMKAKFIIAGVLASFLQLFLSSKDIHLRYLVSGLVLALPITLFSVHRIIEYYVSKTSNRQYLLLALFILFGIFKLDDLYALKDEIRKSTAKFETFNKILTEYPKNQYLHLLGYRSTSQSYALHYGSLHAGNQRDKYWKVLDSLYPETYLYPWIEREQIYTWCDTLNSFEELYSKNNKILFWGNHLFGLPPFFKASENDSIQINSELIYDLDGQKIFLIEVKPRI